MGELRKLSCDSTVENVNKNVFKQGRRQ